MHNVTITPDTDANWLAWGQLVLSWVPPAAAAQRPTNVLQLKQAMAAAGVQGNVVGNNTRAVNVTPYDGTGPIIIPIPTPPMVAADVALLTTMAPCPYPLPSFYSTAFGGSPQPILNLNQLKAIATRRLGEYVINECM